jgi:hypothetical protein
MTYNRKFWETLEIAWRGNVKIGGVGMRKPGRSWR